MSQDKPEKKILGGLTMPAALKKGPEALKKAPEALKHQMDVIQKQVEHQFGMDGSSTGHVIFTATYYTSTEDLRFKLCLDTISASTGYLVVVDGSPSDDVHQALLKTRAIVHRQQMKGGKGAALREAAAIASQLPNVTDDTLLCWQEPEKTNMIRHWKDMEETDDEVIDVVMPWRSQDLFKKTYPVEQYHSEMYGNLYLDAIAETNLKALKHKEPLLHVDKQVYMAMDELSAGQHPPKLPRMDWHFGPFAFKAKHVGLWTEYNGGDSYDAQVVPIVHAMRKGFMVKSKLVKYQAPLEMKQDEEGNVECIEKRLMQLNDLDPRVKKAWSEDFYC